MARKFATVTGVRCLLVGFVLVVQRAELAAPNPLFDVMRTVAPPTVWGAGFGAVGLSILGGLWRRASWRLLSILIVHAMVLTAMFTACYLAERWSTDRVYPTFLPIVLFGALVVKDALVLSVGER